MTSEIEQDVSAFRNLMARISPDLHQQIERVLADASFQIVSSFYTLMIDRPESAGFLNHNTVEARLGAALTGWLTSLYRERDEAATRRYVERQIEVGDIHARINVPLAAIQNGTTILKKQIFRAIIGSTLDRDVLADVIIHLDEMIDLTMGLMNRCFIRDMMADARDQQSLKLQAIGMDMALQTEGLRTSLFDWHRQILRLLYEDEIRVEKIPSIKRTNLGLWVTHKGELLFPGASEIIQLKHTLDQIDENFTKLIEAKLKLRSDDIRRFLSVIDEYVVTAAGVLAAMTGQTLALEGGKDPLTKVFNRRFLRTILQREISLSNTTGERFAVFILDIDYFKKINDTLGHDGGDAILRQIAEVITARLRAGDFVFRYGGEEFLAVVSAVSSRTAPVIAEKLRTSIEGHAFILPDGNEHRPVTISMGVAIHDGHPDYSRLISAADEALYQAKQWGRNRWVINQGDQAA